MVDQTVKTKNQNWRQPREALVRSQEESMRDDAMNYEDMLQIQLDGFVDVDCTHGCGESARVEPDGDYPCSCGGRLVSPLVTEEEKDMGIWMEVVGGTL